MTKPPAAHDVDAERLLADISCLLLDHDNDDEAKREYAMAQDLILAYGKQQRAAAYEKCINMMETKFAAGTGHGFLSLQWAEAIRQLAEGE